MRSLGIALGVGFAIDGDPGTDADPDPDSDPERKSRNSCRGGLHAARPSQGCLLKLPALQAAAHWEVEPLAKTRRVAYRLEQMPRESDGSTIPI